VTARAVPEYIRIFGKDRIIKLCGGWIPLFLKGNAAKHLVMAQSTASKCVKNINSGLFKFGFTSNIPVDKNDAAAKKRRMQSQKEYEVKRQRNFREDWKANFPGLNYNSENNSMTCLFCSSKDVTNKGLHDVNSAFDECHPITIIPLLVKVTVT
jgi:hypothetical protein